MAIDPKIHRLVAAGRYPKAVRRLEQALEADPASVPVRQRLAEVLVLAGERYRAAGILSALAEEFATAGFTAKAIATMKKVQRVDRRSPETAARLAELILERNREIGVGGAEGDASAALGGMSSLRRSPLFDGFNDEELVAVIQGLRLEAFEPGEALFTEGEPGDRLCVIAAGSARVLVRDAAGEDREVRTLGDGDFFGEIALLEGSARTATVRATAPSDVLTLDRETLDSLARRYPRIPEVLRRVADERAGSAEERDARDHRA